MKRFTIFAVLAAATTIHADELVLKDGKTVAWTALRDLGDSYEVETPEGVKLEIKKDQVTKFVPKTIARVQKDKAAEVLTGATFTWDKGRKLQQFDLLASIDLKKDAPTGAWKKAGSAITGTCKETFGMAERGGWARVETSYIPPEEYDITVVLERVDGEDGFVITLVGLGKHQVNFAFDFHGWSGPWTIDGKNPEGGGLGVKERPFQKPGVKKTAVFMVRQFGFAVKLDGQDFFAWRGDWSRVGINDLWKSGKTNAIVLSSGISVWKVHSAVVTFPK
jgi:hypothetical protein